MLRARLSNGRFILGLTAENLRRLQAGEPIHVDLALTGGKDFVYLIYGETVEAISAHLTEKCGPLPPAQPWPEDEPRH